jgi:hypothetical protein
MVAYYVITPCIVQIMKGVLLLCQFLILSFIFDVKASPNPI